MCYLYKLRQALVTGMYDMYSEKTPQMWLIIWSKRVVFFGSGVVSSMLQYGCNLRFRILLVMSVKCKWDYVKVA